MTTPAEALLHELRNALIPLDIDLQRGTATLGQVSEVVNRLLVFAAELASEQRKAPDLASVDAIEAERVITPAAGNLRAILRKHLYALNDGLIIPCLLDLSAAVERIAKATGCAPYDPEKMAQRVEEMAADKRGNFWRALNAAEVTRDHRGMFFRALDDAEKNRSLLKATSIGHDIGTEGWHREQALHADKMRPRQDDIGGPAKPRPMRPHIVEVHDGDGSM
jgi:non-ribosomal peptide synthetase component F